MLFPLDPLGSMGVGLGVGAGVRIDVYIIIASLISDHSGLYEPLGGHSRPDGLHRILCIVSLYFRWSLH